ncbi:unnamed protein product [Linum trigynum]|uniref:Ureide permease n=1 Tax=Linum trigynum TaxID=586398 RepID=A0AAV2CV10_9ROSI
MYLVESKGGAIACMFLSLFFLGTWPAILTLLERRGRLPQHTYLDYSITNLLAAVIIALTFGQIGSSTHESPNFFPQLSQLGDNWPSVLFAMAGGLVLSLGNLCTQYAWAFVGLSVTEVITSSLVVVIGTTLNYFLDNKINRAEILFPGVACFFIAVCFGSAVHSSNSADNKAKLSSLPTDRKNGENVGNGSNTGNKAVAGTADFLIELENRRSIKVFGKSTMIGLAITFFARLLLLSLLTSFQLGNQRSMARFMGGQAAGYAAADAVQALPLVSTFWGILIFKEYRKSSRRTYILLVAMLSMFIAAVGILMASSGHRK